MADVTFHFDVDGADFSSAGEASVKVKKKLRQLGVSPDVIRKVSIAMYEGEINMVIHAEGGVADVTVTDNEVVIVLADKGPGIPDVALAMKEGYSTARDNIRALGRSSSGNGTSEYEEVHRFDENRHRSRRRHDHNHEGQSLIAISGLNTSNEPCGTTAFRNRKICVNLFIFPKGREH